MKNTAQQLLPPPINPPERKTMEVKESHDLICTENHSNKFWKGEILLEPSTCKSIVRLSWGRVGLEGQKRDFVFNTFVDAKRYLDGRLKDKKKKFYLYKDKSTIKVDIKTKTPDFQSEWDLF